MTRKQRQLWPPLARIHSALGALSTLSASTTGRHLCLQLARPASCAGRVLGAAGACHEIGTYGKAVI